MNPTILSATDADVRRLHRLGHALRRRVRHFTRFRLTVSPPDGVFSPFMKVVSSIKSAKKRHPACQVVRRRGKIYVINKVEPRYKARQG